MAYRASDYPPFAVTVDLVVLTVRDDALQALVVRRGSAPFEGRWALPGGFVQVDEDVAAAAERELAEETGLRLTDVHLEQLATYGDPRRDPRMRVVSVAHLALAADLPDAGGRQRRRGCPLAAGRRSARRQPRLAFDHDRILRDGVERARAKLEYTPLAASFCGEPFTVGELRRVYEVVWGQPIDPRNFHRKVTGAPGFLVETGETTTRQGGRPAQLYRVGGATLLVPPLLRG